MKIDEWRGAGSVKYRVLNAVERTPKSVDAIWRAMGSEHYAAISPTLNDGKKKGLVDQYRDGRNVTYRCTDAGREWLADTRKRFE